MATCTATGCKIEVPAALDGHKLCVLHFTLSVETACAGMRRETVLGNAPRGRQRSAPRGRNESPRPEHLSDAHEPARKPRPVHASPPARTHRRRSLIHFPIG